MENKDKKIPLDPVTKARALQRDNNKCTQCGVTENLDVHHKVYINPVRLNHLITLCRSCHRSLHGKMNRNKNANYCMACGSSQVYVRLSSSEVVCRRCGTIMDKQDEKKK